MDLPSAAKLADDLMQTHGLTGWSFGFNRAKRQLGVCRFAAKRIELSAHFVSANDEAAVRDTLLHEIAHALAGREAGHGPRWKAICAELGCKPERLDHEAVMPEGRWRAKCPSCSEAFHRHRRPMRGRTYACRRCGPRRGKLRFETKPASTPGV